MIGFSVERPQRVPFPAIVGQERLKRGLLAVAVDDAIDGLLIRGEKGTAKSTAVRGLVDLLPTQRAVADCPYGCPPDDPPAQCESCQSRTDPPIEERQVPLVTVPLGATRERIVGSLSVSDALEGEANFEPGLLARAHRGFLYVDEVNLLDDHLVDVLLDAAASGTNRVERDGMSVSHPAEFTLLGTMNPEEGDVRPQLRDRFAIQATVEGNENVEDRVAIIDTALGADPGTGANDDYESEVAALRNTIREARGRLEDVTVPTEYKRRIAEVCRDAGVDGHRGDIAAARTATALSALDGRSQVIDADVREALELALPHRLQARPFEDSEDLSTILEDHFGDSESGAGDTDPEPGSANGGSERSGEGAADGGEDAGSEPSGPADRDERGANQADGTDSPDAVDGSEPEPGDGGTDTEPEGVTDDRPESATNTSADVGTNQGPEDADDGDDRQAAPQRSESGASESESVSPARPAHRPAPVGEGADASVDLDAEATRAEAESITSGRAGVEPSPDGVGPRIRTEPATSDDRIDAPASVRAAAKDGRTAVESRDLRQSVRAGTATALVVFAVDASASMRPVIEAAKGTVMSLLEEAYQERDEAAFVAFAGEDAEVLLPPTDSVTLAARHLKELPTGDRTPLPAGLKTVREVIDRAEPAASVAVIVTDGRANVATESPTAETRDAAGAVGTVADQVLVVDAGESGDRASLIEDIATETEGRVISLERLSSDAVGTELDRARE